MQLVGAARRRTFTNLVGEQLSVGLMAAMAGAVVLLLIGTQILDWWWPVALFIGGAGLSAWRTRKLLPSPYSVAQIVDRRLELKDSISTAFHFLQDRESRPVSQELAAAQCAQAEQAAASLDVASAIPWRMPRQIMPAIALAGVALTLFAIRYGTSGRLDLSKPIVESVADFFQLAPDQTLAKNGKAPKMPGQDPLGIDITNPDQERQKLDQATEDALQVVETPDVNAGSEGEAKLDQKQVKAAAGDQAGEDKQDSGEEGDRAAASDPNEKGGDGESGKTGQKAAKDQMGDQAAKQSGGDNSSLMDKMRDAMANLMAKMKMPQQQGSGQQQQASNQKGGQKQGGKRDSGAGKKGEKGQGNPQTEGSSSDDPDAKGDEAGDQQAQAGQGQSNDKGQEGGSPNEAKAGMGKQDGNKEIKDAEQKAAMGKLSEIFGKRAENIRGDVMVEVTSSKQQLRTGYTQRGATHGDSGGEVHRDEIPQHLQHYVQQYFEQVRKGDSTAVAASAAPGRVPAPGK